MTQMAQMTPIGSSSRLTYLPTGGAAASLSGQYFISCLAVTSNAADTSTLIA